MVEYSCCTVCLITLENETNLLHNKLRLKITGLKQSIKDKRIERDGSLLSCRIKLED